MGSCTLRLGILLAWAAFWLFSGSSAYAQEQDSMPAYATTEVGDTQLALPGYARVGTLEQLGKPMRLAFSLSGGYGWTEAQQGDAGDHHRLIGNLAVGFRALDWLSMYLLLEGRYDKHPDDTTGSDDGLAGKPSLGIRGGYRIFKGLYLGGQLDLTVPGNNAPSLQFEALTLDTKLLATYYPDIKGLSVGMMTGFRYDRSGEAEDAPDLLRRGDRLALGLSDFNAVLLGLGASYRYRIFEWFGEWSWDVLVGSGAPSVANSPMRITAGMRVFPTNALELEFLMEASPSARPSIGTGNALIPIEPRITTMLAVRYRLPFVSPSASSPNAQQPGAYVQNGQGPSITIVEAKDAPTGVVEGRVTNNSKEPLEGIRVELSAGDFSRVVETDAEGAYRFDKLPPGDVKLTAVADGYEPVLLEAKVEDKSIKRLDFVLGEPPPMGQLRGLVRGFDGKPLRAQVLVFPLKVEHITEDNGQFEFNIPPGRYRVVIRARDHRRQRRWAVIEKNGVTVLNVELRQSK